MTPARGSDARGLQDDGGGAQELDRRHFGVVPAGGAREGAASARADSRRVAIRSARRL